MASNNLAQEVPLLIEKPANVSTLDYLTYHEKPRQLHVLKFQHSPTNCLVKLHGLWYDLTEFQDRHPGGREALRLAAGRDATIMFESHHVFSSDKLIKYYLDKYRLSPEESAHLLTLEEACFEGVPERQELLDPFDPLSTSKFGSDLKERVREYFQNLARKRGVTLVESTKASPAKCRLMASLAVMWAVSLVLLLRGNYSMLLIHPLFAWMFTAATFHDALHFALSTNPTINSVVGNLFPYLASPFGWYHQHVIGHHPFTNIPNRDPDLLHGSESSNKVIAQYLPFDARLALFFMTATSLGLGLQNELFLVLGVSRSYNGVVPRIPVSVVKLIRVAVLRVVFFLVSFGWPFVFLQGMNLGARFAFSVVPHAVYSTLFMINSQVNHQSEATKSARSRDWFVHQVITAQNFGDSSVGGLAWWFHYIMSGGLCLQMEHHLFPTVNHCHLPAVAKIVKQVCYEHGVPYTRADGYGQALAEYYRQEKKESKKFE
ncbi:hypothetical protein HDU78_003328 [Chytriomyces hyalinus]|nr:hypothetical protein HDU78_003328 [Chytriomyces hyalinus]